MTTLISAHNSSGCIGRCDAKCHDASGPECNCICDGKNHGVRAKRAIENATAEWQEWIDAYQSQHDEKLRFEVNSQALFQIPMC